MASHKKHFVRYNPVADRLESFSGRTRPKGSGWTELPINFCCAIPIPALGEGGACDALGIVPYTDVDMTVDGGNIRVTFSGGNAAAGIEFRVVRYDQSPFNPGPVSDLYIIVPGSNALTTGETESVSICETIEIYFKAPCETLWHQVVVKEGIHCGE